MIRILLGGSSALTLPTETYAVVFFGGLIGSCRSSERMQFLTRWNYTSYLHSFCIMEGIFLRNMNTNMYIYTCTNTCKYMYIYKYMYFYMCVRICMCVYVCLCVFLLCGWLGGWVWCWCGVGVLLSTCRCRGGRCPWSYLLRMMSILQRARAERSMIECRVGQCMECVVLAPFSN